MKKEYLILTNNPLLKGNDNNVLFEEESFQELLFKARDMTHLGYRLITHPLGASMRMMFSPYRSLLLGKKSDSIDTMSIVTIESGIESYKAATKHRKEDLSNNEDYALIDKELLLEAIKEYEKISASERRN